MASTKALLRLGLGGSYFKQFTDAAGVEHIDFRMNQTVFNDSTVMNDSANTNTLTQSLSGMGFYSGPVLGLNSNVTDGHMRRLGIIPDGSQGVKFDESNQESASGFISDRDSGVPGYTFQSLDNIRALCLFGSIDTLPASGGQDPVLFGLSVTVPPSPVQGPVFALTLDSSGILKGMYGLSSIQVVDFDVSSYVSGSPILIGLTREVGDTNDTIRLYVDGVLRDTGIITHETLGEGQVFPSNLSYFLTAGSTQVLSNDRYIGMTVYHMGIMSASPNTDAFFTSQSTFDTLEWTDVGDVLRRDTTSIERGIRDDSPLSRVASTGVCQLSMNNSRIVGLYSPGHPSCLSGFKKGIPAWIRFQSPTGAITNQFFGRIEQIAAEPGYDGSFASRITIRDIINIAARTRFTGIPTQLNVRSDRIFQLISMKMNVQPVGFEAEMGSDVYPIALDNSQDEQIDVLGEYVRLCHSELGYVYVTRNGVLKFEARDSRIINSPDPIFTVDGTSVELDVAEVSGEALNTVQTTVHQRTTDVNNTTVLWALEELVRVNKDESKTFNGPYRNPNTPYIDARVGGMDMLVPVADTDYQLNTAQDGAGLDLTPHLAVVANLGANSVEITVTNNHPLYDGYLIAAGSGGTPRLQVRGRGVYDFRTVVLEAKNQEAVDEFGVNDLQVDMVYQADPNLGQGAADFLLNTWASLTVRARSVSIIASDPRWDIDDILQLEISNRILVREVVSGLDSEYYINGIRHEIDREGILRTKFWLTPASPLSYWVLGDPTQSILDFTTRLFYL